VFHCIPKMTEACILGILGNPEYNIRRLKQTDTYIVGY